MPYFPDKLKQSKRHNTITMDDIGLGCFKVKSSKFVLFGSVKLSYPNRNIHLNQYKKISKMVYQLPRKDSNQNRGRGEINDYRYSSHCNNCLFRIFHMVRNHKILLHFTKYLPFTPFNYLKGQKQIAPIALPFLPPPSYISFSFLSR